MRIKEIGRRDRKIIMSKKKIFLPIIFINFFNKYLFVYTGMR